MRKIQTPPFDITRDILDLQKRVARLEQKAVGSQLYNYTTTWSSLGTAPSLGNGTLNAHYMRIGIMVWVHIYLQWGSTTTAGTSDWTFSLPFPSSNIPESAGLGAALVHDSSSNDYYGGATEIYEGTLNDLRMFCRPNTTAVGAGNPIIWATGDHLTAAIFYPSDV